MKRVVKVLGVIFLVFILIGVGGIFFLSRGLEAGNEVTINDIDLSALSDGIYHGKYESGRWANEVNVTIEDHKITDITVVKDLLFKKPEVTEELIAKILQEQSTNVDAVSGATVSCKAYLKAIENALLGK